VKIAGIKRDTIANGLLSIGGITAMWTGAIGSLVTGVFLGTAAVVAHAVMRPPNNQAKLQNFKRKLIAFGEDLTS
jgi:uncharacterized membrane protein (UPF0136 family)